MGIATDLADYDGKTVANLESLKLRYTPDDELLSELVRLTIRADENAAIGASWLLRAWLSSGARLPDAAVSELTAGLGELPGHWVRLHVCHLVPHVTLDTDGAQAWADVLDGWRKEPRPFLRAWATDALVRLSASHPEHAAAARTALEEALTDHAASVRARARKIIAEED